MSSFVAYRFPVWPAGHSREDFEWLLQLPLKLWRRRSVWLAPSFMTSHRRLSALSVLSACCQVVHVWTGSCGNSLTDQVSLYYSWWWLHFSDTEADWNHSSSLQHWISHIRRPCATSGLSVICLVNDLPLPKQPWNLKPNALCRHHGWLREAQSAEFVWCSRHRWTIADLPPDGMHVWMLFGRTQI